MAAATKKTATVRNGDLSSRVETATTEAKMDEMAIVIPRIQPKILEVEIEGTTPLLVNHWSKKAIQMMLDSQTKAPKKAREAKNPEAEYKASLYVSTEGWTGIPAGGVKGCLVAACRLVNDLPMTLAKRMVFIMGQGVTEEGQELVRVYGEHEMHQAMVRLPSGTADIRFRALYREWSIKLQINFLENVVTPEQILNLLELAGFSEGLCEHRPGAPKNATGSNGRFSIKRDE